MTNTFSCKTLNTADIKGKKVLLRAGFDVPVENAMVADESRIVAMLPSMKAVLDGGGTLILLAHQGRPKGEKDPSMSQKPLLPVLEKLLNRRVIFAENCIGAYTKELADALKPGEVLLLENVRFEKGEKSKDAKERDVFAKQLSELADVYVNDAFTNCHRDHASMTGIPKYLPSYIGLHLEKEIRNLSAIYDNPQKPITLIISGAKMETKIPVITNFLNIGNNILLGGLIANTFLSASGFSIGASIYEDERKKEALEILSKSKKKESAVLNFPNDVVVACEPDVNETDTLNVSSENVPDDMMIFDIGKNTASVYSKIIEKSKMIIWNGPMGKYETPAFSKGSIAIANSVSNATKNGAVSIIGGGDTIDLHSRYGLSLDSYTWVSTGGGAMLEFISGSALPALEALK